MRKRLLAISSVFAVLLIAFNNCARSSFKAQEFDVPVLTESSSLGLSPSCKPRRALQPRPPKVSTALAAAPIEPETELMVVLDARCARDQGLRSVLSQRAFGSGEHLNTSPGRTAGALRLDNTVDAQELAIMAEQDPCVISVARNERLTLNALPVDPLYTKQTYLSAVSFPQVVDRLYNDANGINQIVKVAVIDSGVDVNHPDLQTLFLRDGAGDLVALNGFDGGHDVGDSGFHGTHVTGLIAAAANSVGITGVMGQNIRIMPVKVSEDGSSIDLAALLNGIYWAADNGANVINLSISGPNEIQTLRDALVYAADKGVFIAVAAGNNGESLRPAFKQFPAMYSKDIKGMITVGSFDATSRALSSFSNYSSQDVDILSPGSDGSKGILSTVPSLYAASGYAQVLQSGGVTVQIIHGTSMATPLVSGTAAAAIALARSRGYDAPPDQIEALLEAGAERRSSYGTYSKNGASLNIKKLMDTLDTDTGLSLATTTGREQARGQVAISKQPVGMTVALGDPIQLSVEKSVGSSILVNYQWYKNDTPLAGQRGPQLNIESAAATDVGQYHVAIKAGTTVVRSDKVRVSIDGVSDGTGDGPSTGDCR